MIRSRKPEIQIASDIEELSRRAAEEFVRLTEKAILAKGLFTVALSGGSTPKKLYALLGSESDLFKSRIPWDQVHLFWGDERHVPPDHPENNYRMVNEAMLSEVTIPAENVHRLRSEIPDAGRVAEVYEHELRRFFELEEGRFPRFDLVLLGMGPDGHTASLFPHTTALDEREHLVVANYVEKFGAYRLTLTAPVINQANNVIFLIAGEAKAWVLKDVLEGDYDPRQLPSQLIRPVEGRLLVLVDRAAAKQL